MFISKCVNASSCGKRPVVIWLPAGFVYMYWWLLLLLLRFVRAARHSHWPPNCKHLHLSWKLTPSGNLVRLSGQLKTLSSGGCQDGWERFQSKSEWSCHGVCLTQQPAVRDGQSVRSVEQTDFSSAISLSAVLFYFSAAPAADITMTLTNVNCHSLQPQVGRRPTLSRSARRMAGIFFALLGGDWRGYWTSWRYGVNGFSELLFVILGHKSVTFNFTGIFPELSGFAFLNFS